MRRFIFAVVIQLLIVLSMVLPVSAEEPQKEAGKADYDKGFSVSSADKNYALKMNFAIQFRYTYLDFDEKIAANYEDWSNFFMRRARLWFQGNAPTKDWAYYIHVQLEPQSAVNLHDAYITWKKYSFAQLQIGRAKIPYGYSFLTSATQLNGVERTIFTGETDVDGKTDARKWPGGNANFPVSDEDTVTKFPIGGLNLFRSQGLHLQGEAVNGGLLQYWAGVYNGRNTKGSASVDTAPLLFGKLAVNPLGKCNLSQQGDIDNTESPKVCVLGSAMQYADRLTKVRSSSKSTGGFGTEQAVTPYDINVSGYNVAAVFRFKGASLDVEYGAEEFEQERTGGETWERLGYMANAGYFIVKKKCELVARYAYVERLKDNTKEKSLSSGLGLVGFDGGTDNAVEKSLKEYTVGLNHYFDGHRLKVYLDYSRLVRELSPAGATAVDDQSDNRYRAMMQWFY